MKTQGFEGLLEYASDLPYSAYLFPSAFLFLGGSGLGFEQAAPWVPDIFCEMSFLSHDAVGRTAVMTRVGLLLK